MRWDLVVIGGGPGGYTGAIRAAQLGLKTALVERAEVGGTCLNRGCIPTKALLESAHLYREVQGAAAFGVQVEGISFDYAAMDRRKAQVVEQLRTGVEGLLKGNGVSLIRGEAVIQGPGLVRVGEEELEAAHILIAAGSRPALPPVPGLDLPGVITSDQLLGEGRFYPRLAIIGGGVIGMEFASLYTDLGAEVTVIEAMDRVLPTMDRELSQNLTMLLKRAGARICTGARVERVEASSAASPPRGRRRPSRRTGCWWPPAAGPMERASAPPAWRCGWSGAASWWTRRSRPACPARTPWATSSREISSWPMWPPPRRWTW